MVMPPPPAGAERHRRCAADVRHRAGEPHSRGHVRLGGRCWHASGRIRCIVGAYGVHNAFCLFRLLAAVSLATAPLVRVMTVGGHLRVEAAFIGCSSDVLGVANTDVVAVVVRWRRLRGVHACVLRHLSGLRPAEMSNRD